MTIDYEKIAQDNIGRYGSEVNNYGPILLAHLYSDKTHFIFELLQNAEDALSKRAHRQQSIRREVLFHIFKDRLEFSHYGVPFSEDDVRGICGLVQSTKKEDATAIGKFGIGFKSVYAYTLSPEVHSGDEHFVIESFVRPSPRPARKVSAGQTLFCLPFDNPKVKAEEAFEEISTRLQGLGARSLMFLSQIVTVEWKIEGRGTGAYSRQNRRRDGATTYITLSSRDGRSRSEEEWICFEQPISFPRTDVKGKVQAAFSLQTETKGGHKAVRPITGSMLYAFFPTEKETHLGMLIQGPYRTTPSRDNIPKDDAWNKQLVKLTAGLIESSLEKLRNLDLLSVGALESMPLNSRVFSTEHFLRPLFDRVRNALTKKPLLPRYGGGFVAGVSAKLARGRGLRELLNTIQLQTLLGTTKKLEWVSDEISEDKTPQLQDYLIHDVGIEEFTPQNFASRVSDKFFRLQPDKWTANFYEFLSDQPNLWRTGGPMRAKPFIRTHTNRQLAPFDSNGRPQVYLPAKGFTGYETVKNAICLNKAALDFLKELGLTEPDLVDDVVHHVLPKYSGKERQVSDNDYSSDIARLLSAFKTDSEMQRAKLVTALRNSSFVIAVDAADGTKCWSTPEEVYLASQRLKELFQGVSGILLVDDSYSCLRGEDIRELLEAAGSERYLKPVPVDREFTYDELYDMRKEAGAAKSSGGESIKDYTLRGIDELLSMLPRLPQEQYIKKSGLLWEALNEFEERKGPRGFAGTYLWNYHNQHRCNFPAAFVFQLNEAAWVPDKSGALQPPHLIVFDSLDPPWKPNATLFMKIRFKQPAIEVLAREVGIEPGVLDFLKKKGITSVVELMARLGVEEKPEQPVPRDVDDAMKNILGDALRLIPPISDPMGSEAQGSDGGSGRGRSGSGHGTGTFGEGATLKGSTGDSTTGGRSGSTDANKRTSGSDGGRRFISYVGTHPDDDEPDPDGLNQSARMALEEQAITHILSREPELARTPTNNPGFDLFESDADGNPVRWVEQGYDWKSDE